MNRYTTWREDVIQQNLVGKRYLNILKLIVIISVPVLIFGYTAKGKDFESKEKCIKFSLRCYHIGEAFRVSNCKNALNAASVKIIEENNIDLGDPYQRFFLKHLMKICREMCELSHKITFLEAIETSEEKCEIFVNKLKKLKR